MEVLVILEMIMKAKVVVLNQFREILNIMGTENIFSPQAANNRTLYTMEMTHSFLTTQWMDRINKVRLGKEKVLMVDHLVLDHLQARALVLETWVLPLKRKVTVITSANNISHIRWILLAKLNNYLEEVLKVTSQDLYSTHSKCLTISSLLSIVKVTQLLSTATKILLKL